jgi:hypothetical protein
MNDPIVEEVRKIREDYLERFNYDLEAIFRDLKAQEQKGDHKVVSLPPRRLQQAEK